MKLVCMQEVGHSLAAFPKKVKLSIPFFIPNITLGSFGAITQVNDELEKIGFEPIFTLMQIN